MRLISADAAKEIICKYENRAIQKICGNEPIEFED